MGKHYIAMNGSHGCLPDNADVYETVGDAVEGLDFIFEFSTRQKRELKRADYCEIVECACKNPEVHVSN